MEELFQLSQPSTEVELTVNLKIAKALGLATRFRSSPASTR
jgi:hypothetical protein